MQVSPRHKRMIARVLPYGIIWLVTGVVFILVETAAMGTTSPDSPTIINLSWTIILFASAAITFVGFLVGLIEITYVEKRFRNTSFFIKVIGKFLLYTLLMLVVTLITYPIAASLELSAPLMDKSVWNKFGTYLNSITFLSTLLQMGCSLLLSVVFSAVSEHIGHTVLLNLLIGKYHRPKEENRIFLFLDMKASTSYAEELGHVRYFEFLSKYYENMSGAIIDYSGEVYQYVGDEVVISWDYKRGLYNNNCVNCFFALKDEMTKKLTLYKKEFGIAPSFKGGIHIGKVTTGEIGALKKQIFYTGDVLNVTSRLQGLCSTYNTDFIASVDIVNELHVDPSFVLRSLGDVSLKGRVETMEIFSIEQ